MSLRGGDCNCCGALLSLVHGMPLLLTWPGRCAQDLCRFNNCDLADEIDLYEWSPGAMMDWDGTEDDDVPLYSEPLHPDAPVPTR